MIEIKGMEPLIAKLEKGLNIEPVKEVVKMNGAELHKGMQRMAPIDTGHLKRSIVLTMGSGGLSVKVVPTANYASYVNWGTRFMVGTPFVKVSYQKQREKFLADLKRLVK